MGLLQGITVHDAGTSVATAHALRLLDALGAQTTTSNPAAVLLDDGALPTAARPGSADIVLDDGENAGATVTVALSPAGGAPDAVERRLQEDFGLAALTGEPEGPPQLTTGWPALLHAGAQAAVAALLGLVTAARRGIPGVRLAVDARAATASMLDDALLRAARGQPPRGRTRGAGHLQATGRLARAADGWVSLSLSGAEDRATLDALATAAGAVSAEAWIASRSRRQVFATLQEHRLPCGMGLSPVEVLDDPLFLAEGTVRRGRVMPPFRIEPWLAPPWTPPLLPPSRRPLEGIRVVEMAALWAGPAATAVLAEWGAVVVKVEAPGRLDGFRGDGGTRFAVHNRGKRSVLLDLHSDEGVDGLRALLRTADLLVDANAPRVLANLGLDAASLRRLNPSLIVVHVPALPDPPDAWPQHVAYGFDQEMLCGQAIISPDAPVRPAGIPLGDPVAAMATAAAALAALRRRLDDGTVAHVTVAQLDALLHQVAPRCATARRGRTWAGDALAGEFAPAARDIAAPELDAELRRLRGIVDVVERDGVTRSYPRTGISFVDGPPPLGMRAPEPGEHTAAELALSTA